MAAPIPLLAWAPRQTPLSTLAQGEDGRSFTAGAAVVLAELTGTAKRAVDATRLVAAYPHAAGRRGAWASEFVLGASNNIVPNQGRFFRPAYRMSNGLNHVTESMHAIVAVPNLIDGWQQAGPAGLVTTLSGRTGLLQTGAAALSLGIMGRASWGGRAQGARGVWQAATGAELLGRPSIVRSLFGINVLTLANEAGSFNSLNRDNEAAAGSVLRDSLKNVPRHLPLLFM